MSSTNPAGIAQIAANDAAPGIKPDTERSRAEVLRLAQEFEALLLTQMLKDMRRSMVDDEDEKSEFGAMTDTIDVEFGRTISASGGFGLTGTLLKALDRLAGNTETESADRGVAEVAAAYGIPIDMSRMPTAVQTASVQVPSSAAVSQSVQVVSADSLGPVTSEFGWRRDPLTGAPGFHSGVDVGMAYGREVRAVAAGRVTFAGERGGYGNMVSIAHDDGRETRYAHLASHSVKVGDIVTPDQVLGRSGSSGRATGPHLHFEVLVNGRPVDPLDRGQGR
ncbi:MAG: peptidoglycan DD-metalloendopeptidase family protein [Acidobacteria bacterium]|nr:peptidoglycan DD-metalloendopeptidase family protein [Acidobacteriota bacterium]